MATILTGTARLDSELARAIVYVLTLSACSSEVSALVVLASRNFAGGIINTSLCPNRSLRLALISNPTALGDPNSLSIAAKGLVVNGDEVVVVSRCLNFRFLSRFLHSIVNKVPNTRTKPPMTPAVIRARFGGAWLAGTRGDVLLAVLVDKEAVPVEPIVFVETGGVLVALKTSSDPGMVVLPTTRDCRINGGAADPTPRYVMFSVCGAKESSVGLWKVILFGIKSPKLSLLGCNCMMVGSWPSIEMEILAFSVIEIS